MGTQLSAVQIIEFDAQVKAAYQAVAKLRRHVRLRTGITGKTHKFSKAGRGVATLRGAPSSDVVPMNTSFAHIDCSLTDWNAPEYTDIFLQQGTNVEERAVIAANVAAAIGRREDQLILDALDAANASANIAHGSTGLTDAKMRRAQALFDARAVPIGKRKMAISARAKEDLLGDARFSSRDYVESYVIRTGMLPQIYGFDIEVIEDRDEGGLPLASTTRTNYAWDADAVGLAVGMESGVTVDWVPEKTSHLVNKLYTAGAVAIDTVGVLEIETTES